MNKSSTYRFRKSFRETTEIPQNPSGNSLSPMDMNYTAAAHSTNSSCKSDRRIASNSSRLKQPSNASRNKVQTSPKEDVACKRQINTFERRSHKSCTTIDSFATPDDQTTRPTVEKSIDKSILTYRKPPDSNNAIVEAVRTNDINKRVREHTVYHQGTIIVASDIADDHPTQPNIDEIDQNNILDPCVPPDSTNGSPDHQRANETDEVTIRSILHEVIPYYPAKRYRWKELDCEYEKLWTVLLKDMPTEESTLQQYHS